METARLSGITVFCFSTNIQSDVYQKTAVAFKVMH